MIAEVYDALKSAGADEDKARAAATAVAGQWQIDHRVAELGTRMDRLEGRMDRLEQRVAKIESDLAVLKWMVGFAVALGVANLFFSWQIILRLPAG